MQEEEQPEETIDLSSITLDRRLESDRRIEERRLQTRRSTEDRRKNEGPIDFDDRRRDERRQQDQRRSPRRATGRREPTNLDELPEIDWESEALPVEMPSLNKIYLRLILLLLAVAAVVALVLFSKGANV